MMRRIALWRDERGAAAIEFALILPILVALMLLGVDGWMRINQQSAMRSALQTGARYYQGGGADDNAAAQLALQSWANAPTGATVTAARTCSCGGVGASCASQCAGSTLPAVNVTLTATANYAGLMNTAPLSASGSVRIR
jgi:Flp pilus assembly protein TadG